MVYLGNSGASKSGPYGIFLDHLGLEADHLRPDDHESQAERFEVRPRANIKTDSRIHRDTRHLRTLLQRVQKSAHHCEEPGAE